MKHSTVIALLILVCVAVASVIGWKFGDEKYFPPKSVAAGISGTPDNFMESGASRCLQGFWMAKNYKTKLEFVRSPKRVAPLMREYYVTQRHQDPEEVALEFKSIRTIGSTRLAHFGFKTKFPGSVFRSLEAAVILETDGSFRLDWESYVGASEMSWSDFKRQRPVMAARFRVFISKSEYYNFQFKDRNAFAAYLLTSPDGDYELHGYCQRRSDLFLRLSSLLLDHQDKPTPVTLMLSFPRNADSDSGVSIEKLTAESWLVLD